MYRCRVNKHSPPMREFTKNMLTPSEQRLIDMAYDLQFGSILRIPVRNGQLQLSDKQNVKRKYQLDKNDGKNHPKPSSGFALRQQQRNLIARIRDIESGIVTIEICDGLPVKLTVDEVVDIGAKP